MDAGAVKLCCNAALLIMCLFFTPSDKKTDQSGAAALQRGGGDVEEPAASKHCSLLRLLEVHSERTQVCPSSHRTDDLRHPQNVRLILKISRVDNDTRDQFSYFFFVAIFSISSHSTGT